MSEMGKIACRECGLQYAKQYLDFHLSSEHHIGNKGHQCLLCGDYFKNPERLLKHQIKVHKAPNPKRVICEFRAKTFDFKDILQRHIKKVHETGQYNWKHV